MSEVKSMAFHKFYVISRLVIGPILSLCNIVSTLAQLDYFSYYLDSNVETLIRCSVFFQLISVVLSIVIAINLKNMTGKGYRWNRYFLLYELFYIAYSNFASSYMRSGISTYSASAIITNLLVSIFFTMLITGLCFALPVCIYYKKRKDYFYDDPEPEPNFPTTTGVVTKVINTPEEFESIIESPKSESNQSEASSETDNRETFDSSNPDIRYQTVNPETDITPTTILSETHLEDAENETERSELKRYHTKFEEFNDVKRQIQEQDKILKESDSKNELVKAKNRKAILEKKKAEIRNSLRSMETGESLKKLIKREANKKIERIDKIADASSKRSYLTTPMQILRQAVTELEKDQFDVADNNRLASLKIKFDKMDDINQKIGELKSKKDINQQDQNRIRTLSNQWDCLNKSVYTMVSQKAVSDLVVKSRDLLIAKYDAIIQGKKTYKKTSLQVANIKYCRFCGSELINNTNFCRKCGKKLN